jgi:hyperosmotically inducible protein
MNRHAARPAPFRLSLIVASGLLSFGVITGCVAAGDAPKAHSDGVSAALTDTAITASVKSRFMSDDRLKSSAISVTTTNGVVTLNGTAGNSDAKSLAADAAKTVDGVKSVDNNLVTPSSSENEAKLKSSVASGSQAMSDTWITTKVKSSLLADSISKGFDVNVDTRDGVVVLKGVLASQTAIDHVKGIAARVEGVKGVDVSMLFVAGK